MASAGLILLYAIISILTVVILAAVFTVATREPREPREPSEHYDPEHHGPHNEISEGPPQVPARGLATAMLETIPIVKFSGKPTSTDVELSSVNIQHDQPTAQNMRQTHEEENTKPTEQGVVDNSTPMHAAEGAVVRGQGDSTFRRGNVAQASPIVSFHDGDMTVGRDSQGCSICTEDFDNGQDQRLLPCTHRFHPACIDPWLLNVSGTCPLCRVDLRRLISHSSEEANIERQRNRAQREEREDSSDEMAPPLTIRRHSRQIDIGEPRCVTREEQASELADYRLNITAYRRQRQSEGIVEVAGDEGRLQTRLSDAFHIRTRRMGQSDAPARASAEDHASRGYDNQESGERRNGESDGFAR